MFIIYYPEDKFIKGFPFFIQIDVLSEKQ